MSSSSSNQTRIPTSAILSTFTAHLDQERGKLTLLHQTKKLLQEKILNRSTIITDLQTKHDKLDQQIVDQGAENKKTKSNLERGEAATKAEEARVRSEWDVFRGVESHFKILANESVHNAKERALAISEFEEDYAGLLDFDANAQNIVFSEEEVATKDTFFAALLISNAQALMDGTSTITAEQLPSFIDELEALADSLEEKVHFIEEEEKKYWAEASFFFAAVKKGEQGVGSRK